MRDRYSYDVGASVKSSKSLAPARVLPEAGFHRLLGYGFRFESGVEVCLGGVGPDVPDERKELTDFEPVHPVQCSIFDGLETTPRATVVLDAKATAQCRDDGQGRLREIGLQERYEPDRHVSLLSQLLLRQSGCQLPLALTP